MDKDDKMDTGICRSKECALDKILPNGEFRDFVKAMREMEKNVQHIEDTMPKKTSIVAYLSVIVTILLFSFGAIYAGGKLSASINTHDQMLIRHEQKIEQLQQNSAQIPVIRDDVKAIKELLLKK